MASTCCPFVTGQNTSPPHKDLFWRSGNYRVVLANGWKLQRLTQPPEQFLFNLDADPTEQHNLVASEPAKLKELGYLMDQIDAAAGKIAVAVGAVGRHSDRSSRRPTD